MLVSVLGMSAQSANAIVRHCNIAGATTVIDKTMYTCAKSSDGSLVYSAPHKLSGTLNIVCGATEAWCQAEAAAFSAKTGVKTTWVRLSSGEIPARLATAKNNPEFDVWHGSPADGFGVGRNQGLLEQYASPGRDAIPAKYKDADGYWSGVYVGALGFCSNTKELRRLGLKVPTSWDDLLNPKLVKGVSIAHPATSGTSYTALFTNVTRLGSEAAGLAYFTKLHKNVLQYTKSGVGPVAIVGRGEAAIGVVFSHDCVAGAEQGFPLKVSFPAEGTGFEVGAVAVVKGAKNPDAAKAYVDWALSPESQNLGPSVAAYQVHTNPKARPDRRMVNLAALKVVDYDFEKAAAAKPTLTKTFESTIATAPKA